MFKLKKFVFKQIDDISEKGIKILPFKTALAIGKLFKLTLLVLFVFFVPFIFLTRKIFNFHFYELQTDRIGYYCSWEPFIMITHFKKIEKKKEKQICFIYHNNIIANKYLTELYKNKMKSFGHYYFLKGYFFWNILTSSYELWTKNKIKTFFKNRVITYPMFVKTPAILKIPQNDIVKGEHLLKSLGVPKNSKWICIHNRDSSYLTYQQKKGYLPKVNFSYHNIRDFSINDLIPAADYFTKKGFYVLRTGVTTNEKLITKNPKIIDYVNSKYRSDFGEIFLFSNCEFYFGSTAGCWKIAKFFRKPAFLINGFGFADLFLMPWKYPGIFKKLKSKQNNKFLSVTDMVKDNLNHLTDKNLLDKKGIEVVNNTPDEILDLAIEAVEYYKKNNINSPKKLDLFFNEVSKGSLKNYKYYKNPIGKKFLGELNI